jgi:phosphate:Na+ symporter
MSTAISVLGGVGLFLLGMTVMTEGLKALAGSALRTMLGKAAATPLRGSFWGRSSRSWSNRPAQP